MGKWRKHPERPLRSDHLPKTQNLIKAIILTTSTLTLRLDPFAPKSARLVVY